MEEEDDIMDPSGGSSSMNLSAALGAVMDVAEEEARLRRRALDFERAFEARGEERFAQLLSEYEPSGSPSHPVASEGIGLEDHGSCYVPHGLALPLHYP